MRSHLSRVACALPQITNLHKNNKTSHTLKKQTNKTTNHGVSRCMFYLFLCFRLSLCSDASLECPACIFFGLDRARARPSCRRFGVFLSSLFTVNTDKPCCWWLYWPAGPMWTARLWYPGSVQFMPSLFFVLLGLHFSCAWSPVLTFLSLFIPYLCLWVLSRRMAHRLYSGCVPSCCPCQLHASQETIVTGVLGLFFAPFFFVSAVQVPVLVLLAISIKPFSTLKKKN